MLNPKSYTEARIALCDIYKMMVEDIDDLFRVDFSADIFDKVNLLLDLLSGYDYIDFIMNNSQNVSCKKIGTLFSILIWSTDDNGAQQSMKTANWIFGNDEYKISIVLHNLDSYPSQDFPRLYNRLHNLKSSTINDSILSYWITSLEKDRLID